MTIRSGKQLKNTAPSEKRTSTKKKQAITPDKEKTMSVQNSKSSVKSRYGSKTSGRVSKYKIKTPVKVRMSVIIHDEPTSTPAPPSNDSKGLKRKCGEDHWDGRSGRWYLKKRCIEVPSCQRKIGGRRYSFVDGGQIDPEIAIWRETCNKLGFSEPGHQKSFIQSPENVGKPQRRATSTQATPESSSHADHESKSNIGNNIFDKDLLRWFQKEAVASAYLKRKMAEGMKLQHAAVCAGMSMNEAEALTNPPGSLEKIQDIKCAQGCKTTSSCSHGSLQDQENNEERVQSSKCNSGDEDGLQEAFEREFDATEKERRRFPWKPTAGSRLRAEFDPAQELPPKILKSKRLHNYAAITKEEQMKANDELRRLLSVANGNENRTGSRARSPQACGRPDHHRRPDCRCRVTSVSRAILDLADGILTPHSIRKATMKEVAMMLKTDDNQFGFWQHDRAVGAILDADADLLSLPYGEKQLPEGAVPGVADLTVHGKEIYRRHCEVQRDYQDAMIEGLTDQEIVFYQEMKLDELSGTIDGRLHHSSVLFNRDNLCEECKQLTSMLSGGTLWYRHLHIQRIHIRCHSR